MEDSQHSSSSNNAIIIIEQTTTTTQQKSSSARQLRAALDELLEIRFPFLDTVEDQNQQFLLVVSNFTDLAQQQAVLLRHTDESERLPIHLACDKNASVEIIQYLLNADDRTKMKSLLTPDRWGDLALHTACSRRNTTLVKLLLDASTDKQQRHTMVRMKDNQGSLPIHMACRYNAPADLVQLLLLEADNNNNTVGGGNDDENNHNNGISKTITSSRQQTKSTLLEKGFYDQLPIHVACRCSAHTDVIKVLLDGDSTRTSVTYEDNVGRLPIHLALLHNPNIPNIKLLMSDMIYGRMDRLGLVQWKHSIERILKSLQTHERDFMASERLQSIRQSLQDLKERVFLLELACWRVSCIMKHHSSSSSPPEKPGDDDDDEEHSRRRDHQRIKSGAEIIVPGVLRYIEDEPITRVVKEFN